MHTIIDDCQKDDVSGVVKCLDFAGSAMSEICSQRLLPRCMSRTALYGSPGVISYLIAQGVDAAWILGSHLCALGTPLTRKTLEVLLANGWDINRCLRGRDAPLLWHVVEDIHLVQWCLDQGANVDSRRHSSRVCWAKTYPQARRLSRLRSHLRASPSERRTSLPRLQSLSVNSNGSQRPRTKD